MDPVQAERARSFGRVADKYERARPGYAAEAVVWLLGEGRSRVVDLGAGTGKLTRQLVELGHDVSAVEPSAEMLERLRAAVPGARALNGRAEAIPLPDCSVDAVVVAQAFHWFDVPPALAEIARVLSAGGRLGLIWNMRDDRVPWVRKLSRMIGAESFEPGQMPPQAIAESGRFGPVEQAMFRLEQPLDRGALLDLVASRSYVATLEPAAREAILANVAALYADVAGPEGVVLPYVTDAYRAARR